MMGCPPATKGKRVKNQSLILAQPNPMLKSLKIGLKSLRAAQRQLPAFSTGAAFFKTRLVSVPPLFPLTDLFALRIRVIL